MNNEVKNSPLNAALVATCSFIGVGFVTGAEIWFYFARFKLAMIFGLVVFAGLSAALVYFSLKGEQLQSKKFSRVKTTISGVSELLVASAMMSGLLEISKNLFGRLWLLVFLCSILIVGFLFFKGLKSFIIYNYFVAIFVLFVIIFLLCNNNYFSINISSDFNFKNVFFSMLFAAIYMFMNIAEIRPILLNVNGLNSKKKKFFFSLAISLVLILLIVTFSVALFANLHVVSFSMPFLLYFKNSGGVVYHSFLVGLVMTMVSTAESCLMGVNERLNNSKNNEKFIKSMVIISSLIIGQISFSCFIKIVYPFIAILNFGLFVCEIIFRKKSTNFS